jgi:hypothetical protein
VLDLGRIGKHSFLMPCSGTASTVAAALLYHILPLSSNAPPLTL